MKKHPASRSPLLIFFCHSELYHTDFNRDNVLYLTLKPDSSVFKQFLPQSN